MKLWRELSIGERIALTFMIVLAILLALALFGYLSGRWDEAEAQPITCMPRDQRDKVRAIMFEAIDHGLQLRIEHVYEQWVIDDRDQPHRASVGARKAIRAWSQTRRFIEQWNPPECPP